jgi:AraC-like DNA-binding protein
MFTMSGSLTLGTSFLTASFISRPDLRGHVLRRQRLTFDTRFAARLSGPASGTGNLFLFLRGTTEVYNRNEIVATNVGATAYLLSDDEIERVCENTELFLRSSGDVVDVIYVRCNLADIQAPVGLRHGPIQLNDEAMRLAKLLPDLIGQVDIATAFSNFGRELGRCGILRAGMFDGESVADVSSRLLQLIADRYQRLNTATTLKELSNTLGLSLRHVGRTFENTMIGAGLPAAGFREDMRVVRLRLASLLLGASDVTVTQVADKVGYSGIVAMSRAFRDAGLPSPGDIRKSLRATPLYRISEGSVAATDAQSNHTKVA